MPSPRASGRRARFFRSRVAGGVRAGEGRGRIFHMKGTAGTGDYLRLSRLVLRLSRRLTRTFDEVLMPALGLSMKDVFVLRLVQDGAVHPGEVAAGLGMPPASVSRALERLESKRLVRRTVDAADHRRFRLAVTDEGEAAVHRIRKLIAGAMREAYRHVPATAITGAIDALSLLDEVLDRRPA